MPVFRQVPHDVPRVSNEYYVAGQFLLLCVREGVWLVCLRICCVRQVKRVFSAHLACHRQIKWVYDKESRVETQTSKNIGEPRRIVAAPVEHWGIEGVCEVMNRLGKIDVPANQQHNVRPLLRAEPHKVQVILPVCREQTLKVELMGAYVSAS